MFGFSCFQTHTQSHRHKKIAHLTAAMPRTIDDSSDIEVHKKFTYPTNANSSNSKPGLETPKSCAAFPKETCVVDGHSYSNKVEILPINAAPKITHFKKSHSLGMGLDMKGKGSGSSASEDDIDQNFSSDGSQDNSGSCVQNEGQDSLILVHDQFQEGHPSDSLHACDVGNHESVLSSGDAPQSEQDSHANFDGAQFSGEANSDNHTTGTPIFGRSSSLPNSGSPGHFLACSLRRIRSAEDLGVLLSKRKELFRHKSQALIIQNQGRIDVLMSNNGKNCSSNPVDGSYRDYNYFDSAKDWIIPPGHEVNVIDNRGEGSFIHQKDELLSKDYKVKRIEEWVTDLQNCGPLEESDGHSPLDDHAVPADRIVLDVLPAKKLEGNFSPGMEVVKKYISSLSPSATNAQLVNYGLPVIPFLSAFSSLRALNLSGNAIARIAAGSLPRGLHILNLSKNKISTIEGLRELTRLRVLDLSYNRILRIGHGLASCSSLKELYLAGNKINEVEGFHRLLKLNVLDLRFNKISTTKCLGQLAANYNSLQALSLEGNPAQTNVGDEQMKKCLQGLLPHLTHFNRQSIKAGSLKDSADRSARLGVTAHQVDRYPKADFKLTRNSTHTAASSKVISSSSRGRRSQAAAVSKSYKNRHARLPPSGTKPVVQQNHLYSLNSTHLPSLNSDLSMRRSRSEGILGAQE